MVHVIVQLGYRQTGIAHWTVLYNTMQNLHNEPCKMQTDCVSTLHGAKFVDGTHISKWPQAYCQSEPNQMRKWPTKSSPYIQCVYMWQKKTHKYFLIEKFPDHVLVPKEPLIHLWDQCHNKKNYSIPLLGSSQTFLPPTCTSTLFTHSLSFLPLPLLSRI